MTLHRLRVLLLLATVLLGPWLGMAHAAQHDTLEPDSTLCAYCVSGISHGAAPAMGLPPLALMPAQAAPGPQAQSLAAGVAGGLPRNRGPPPYS